MNIFENIAFKIKLFLVQIILDCKITKYVRKVPMKKISENIANQLKI